MVPMETASNPDRAPATRRRRARWLLLLAAGILAAGASTATAGPAQEEYNLKIPKAGGGDQTNPQGAQSELDSGDAGTAPPSETSGSTEPPADADGGTRSGDGGRRDGSGDKASSGGSEDDALIAQAGDESDDSSLVSAGTSAAGSSPVGPLLIVAAVLIALAGVLAIRRARRAKVPSPD